MTFFNTRFFPQLFISLFFLLSLSLQAQWTATNRGLTNLQVTSMFAYLDTLYVGTDGGGIFKSVDNGDNWTNVSGNLGNMNVNDIRGGGAPRVLWVSTDGGAFSTENHSTYIDNTSTGLPVSNISYYWFGDSNDPNTEWAVGTNGGGIFTSPNLEGPWNDTNSGISGNGLFVNDLSGYDDGTSSYAVLATDDGMYFSTDTMKTWVHKTTGLTGGALKVHRIFALGTVVLIYTDDGMYFTLDGGDTFTPFISGEALTTFTFSLTGQGIYTFGLNGYHSADFATWDPVDMTGVSGGLATACALNSNYVFVGTQTGGVFRSSLTTSVEEPAAVAGEFQLEQNYPNPFNPSTTIPLSLSQPADVRLLVFNTNGEQVAELLNERLSVGNYYINFDGSSLASGTYFVRMLANDRVFTKKILLIK